VSWTKNNEWLREPQSRASWHSLAGFSRHYKGLRFRLASVALLLCVSASLILAVPSLLRRLHDPNLSSLQLFYTIAALAAVISFQALTTSFTRLARVYLSSQLNRALTEQFQHKLLGVSLEEYLRFERSTNVYQRVIDATNITNQLTEIALTSLQQALGAICSLAALLHLYRPCGFLLGGAYVVLAPVCVLAGRVLQRKRIAILAISFPLASKLLELLKRIAAIKILSASPRITQDINLLLADKVRAERSEALADMAAQASIAAVSVTVLVSGLMTALVAVRHNQLPLAELFAVYLLLGFGLASLGELAKSYISLVSTSANASNFEEVLALPAEKQHSGLALTRKENAPIVTATAAAIPAVEFRNVHFAYEADKAILNGVSFVVAQGEHVALIGKSGSGKSTILRLLLGLIDVQQGEIYVPPSVGTQVLDLGGHRQRMGVVTQEATLFEMSIRDNLCLGIDIKGRLSNEVLWQVLGQVDLCTRIRALPQGLDTTYSAGMLSGGEEQRLTIARVLLRKPDIVVLDEPTSALDFQSEQQVLAAIKALSLTRTTMTIAHRLTTVRSADRVLVLEGGIIVASGTHDSLLETSDYYRSLCSFNTFLL